MAATITLRLGNGALATVIANYLNPAAFGSWGNETLRLFGTRGMIEATDGGARTRLVLNDRDAGALDVAAPAPDWFDAIIGEILDGRPMPIALADELHPTRLALRANLAARAHRHWGMRE
jgi:predicted dehydrogenase